MFYTYQFSEEIPSLSVVNPLILSASTTEATAMAQAPGLRSRAFAAVSTQVAARALVSGRAFSRAQTNVAAFVKIAFHLNGNLLTTASSNVAAVVRRMTYKRGLSSSLAGAASVVAGLPRHVVVAASNAQVILLLRVIAKSFAFASPEVTSVLRAVSGSSYNAVSASAAGLRRSAGLGRGVELLQSTAAALLLRLSLRVAAAQVVFRSLSQNKRLAVASSEVVRILRVLPQRLSVASTQVAAGLPGLKTYLRVLGATSALVAGLLRSVGSRPGARSVEVAAVFYVPGRAAQALSPEVATVIRQPSKRLGSVAGNVAGLARRFGTLKQVVQVQVAVAVGFARKLVAVSAVNAEAARVLTALFRSKILFAVQTGVANLSSHATFSIPKVLTAAQAQAVLAVRGVGRLLPMSVGMAVGAVRQAGRRLPGVLSATAVNSFRTAGKPFAVVAPEVAALVSRRAFAVIQSLVSSQVVAMRPSLSRVRGVASASAVLVVRNSSKLFRLLAPESVLISKGNFRSSGTSQTFHVTVATPHGKIMGVVQAQVAAAVRWFHLFVPAWLQQQTTFLPAQGGPAEPPAFSTIDPMDVTTFAFDWSARVGPNDPILSAAVVSVPPGLSLTSPVFVQGTLVQATVAAFTPLQLPLMFKLRCSVVTQSGRRSTFSIPVPVRSL